MVAQAMEATIGGATNRKNTGWSSLEVSRWWAIFDIVFPTMPLQSSQQWPTDLMGWPLGRASSPSPTSIVHRF